MSALRLWDGYPLEASERLLEGLADPLRGEKTIWEVAHLPPGCASGTSRPDPEAGTDWIRLSDGVDSLRGFTTEGDLDRSVGQDDGQAGWGGGSLRDGTAVRTSNDPQQKP